MRISVLANQLLEGQTIEYEDNGDVVLGSVEISEGSVMLTFAMPVEIDGHMVGGWEIDADTPITVVA